MPVKQSKHLSVLMAIIKLSQINAASLKNILYLAKEKIPVLKIRDVQEVLESGVKEGYMEISKNKYNLNNRKRLIRKGKPISGIRNSCSDGRRKKKYRIKTIAIKRKMQRSSKSLTSLDGEPPAKRSKQNNAVGDDTDLKSISHALLNLSCSNTSKRGESTGSSSSGDSKANCSSCRSEKRLSKSLTNSVEEYYDHVKGSPRGKNTFKTLKMDGIEGNVDKDSESLQPVKMIVDDSVKNKEEEEQATPKKEKSTVPDRVNSKQIDKKKSSK